MQPNPVRALLGLLLLPMLVACGHVRHEIPRRPERSLDVPGVTRFLYTASAVHGFSAPDGGPCKEQSPLVKDGLMGWQPPGRGPVCFHDTVDHGIAPATMGWRWKVTVPRDGDYEVVQGTFGLGIWGSVTVRSGPWGDFKSNALAVLRAESPSCRAEWVELLGAAVAVGNPVRTQGFDGAIPLEDVDLMGCKAGEEVTLTVQLVGEMTRGRLVVEWFGFSAYEPADADQLFGLRVRPAGKPRAKREEKEQAVPVILPF